MANILLVDDDDDFLNATCEILRRLNCQPLGVSTLSQARAAIARERFDLLLLDLMLPDGSGLQILDDIAEDDLTHVALVTGHPAIKALIKTLYGPHISYLLKPIELSKLKALLQKVYNCKDNNDEPAAHFGTLIGESEPMRQLYTMIERVAQTDATIMLQGESGVGKELVARAIHNISNVNGPFVATNCGALPGELIGSELFGHEKGAFTGATGRKPGLFEQAENGTLFLDEITEMPLEQQPHLLRVLETQQLTRLGGTRQIPIHCRVISATNRSLEQLTADYLREDIYFRLAVFPISIPPLRERSGDIPLLTQFFLNRLNRQHGSAITISETALAMLEQYDWPGNVRELQHLIHRAFIMTDPGSGELKLPTQLNSPFSEKKNTRLGIAPGQTIEEMERELISLTLAQFKGDKPKAAESLGISLKTLYNRLNSYEEPVGSKS